MAAKDLRTIVAEMAKVDPGQVGPTFSLQSPAFSSSLKKAVLVASIRRNLGVDCMRAALAKDFAELEQMVRAGPEAPVDLPAAAPQPSPVPLPEGAAAQGLRCGIDLELVESLPEAPDYRTHDFYVRNFTEAERAYCAAQKDPRMHLAARWAAKEALRKCDPLLSAEPFGDIEVVREESGRTFFQRRSARGPARLPHAVSLTHTAQLAAAVVVLPGQDRPWAAWALAAVSALAAAAALCLRK
ncbi:MAG: 4'-phosphopantetheinyl transferase superfamily protein [Elusimicrobia bacterium]|nr:4'-phosphopantetheinyl transferase superfamily protein [Elusimicrobiota bacterium]